jgi:hypothetical protein
MKVFSFDAETNGLWGKAFSIAAVVYDTESQQTIEWIGRCPIQGEVNQWVKENVLPQMEGIEETHENYETMLKDFMEFYMANKQDAIILIHVGLPVEALPVESRLFIDAHDMGILGILDAPFPLVNCSALPEIGISVEAYNASKGIVVDSTKFKGGVHNPLYDSYAAMFAYISAITERSVK